MNKTKLQDKKPVVTLSFTPSLYIVTHRCREWRLNVYRRWKAMQKGKA